MTAPDKTAEGAEEETVTEGAAGLTISVEVASAVPQFVVSPGVKLTLRFCVPAFSTVPRAGEYVKVPAVVLDAFN